MSSLCLQECVPEDLELKQQILRQADQLMTEDVILSSSTSSLLPSVLSADLKHRQQVLVIHPVCPPSHYYHHSHHHLYHYYYHNHQ